MRKCEGSGEAAEAGAKKTRAAVPVASESTEEGRKRKFGCGEELSSLVQLRSGGSRRRRVANDMKPDNSEENAAAANSDDPCASCCSSNILRQLDNDTSIFVDQEVEEEKSVELPTATYESENWRRESSMSPNSSLYRRETTPSSEILAELGELESTTAISPPMSSVANTSPLSRRSTEKKKHTVSEAEVEEFFSPAEKNLQQKFAQKYNFDIVKEEPLEGRYDWDPVKP